MFHQCLNKSQWCGRLVQCDLPELVIMRSAVILLALSLHLSSGFVARVRHDGSWFHSPLHIDHAHTTEPLADPTTVATDHIHRSQEFFDAHPVRGICTSSIREVNFGNKMTLKLKLG